MNKKVNRMIAAYYEAVKNREKRRADLIYKELYKLGIVLLPGLKEEL